VLCDKYEIEFSQEAIQKTVRRLTNQLWKLIPMRENDEDWYKQLQTVTLEIAGLNELFISPTFLQLLSKLEGLQIKEVNFELYRKTIFECINILQELN
jgi:hypothetical protein